MPIPASGGRRTRSVVLLEILRLRWRGRFVLQIIGLKRNSAPPTFRILIAISSFCVSSAPFAHFVRLERVFRRRPACAGDSIMATAGLKSSGN
jgi:hypothetical protein